MPHPGRMPERMAKQTLDLTYLRKAGVGKHLMTDRILTATFSFLLTAALVPATATARAGEADNVASAAVHVLTGQEALGDWTTDARASGVGSRSTTWPPPSRPLRPITSPGSFAGRPGAMPRAPKGFQVSEFATGLRQSAQDRDGTQWRPVRRRERAGPDQAAPRRRRRRQGRGEQRLRHRAAACRSESRSTPLGRIPPTSTSAIPTRSSASPTRTVTSRPPGSPRCLVKDIPSGREQVGGGGHWTRDVEFSKDGKTLFVSVGSRSNVSDDSTEKRRADILAFDPDGKNERVYAWGIRNPVGLAIHPETGQLWTSVNERDQLGDHLVPDYVTHVEEGGFYGWPWYYIGGHQDPRHKGKHPELKDKVIVPDVLVQSHSASLAMTFYTGQSVPRRSIGWMHSPPSTARGTVPGAPATR